MLPLYAVENTSKVSKLITQQCQSFKPGIYEPTSSLLNELHWNHIIAGCHSVTLNNRRLWKLEFFFPSDSQLASMKHTAKAWCLLNYLKSTSFRQMNKKKKKEKKGCNLRANHFVLILRNSKHEDKRRKNAGFTLLIMGHWLSPNSMQLKFLHEISLLK